MQRMATDLQSAGCGLPMCVRMRVHKRVRGARLKRWALKMAVHLAEAIDDIQVGQSRLHHEHVGAFHFVKGSLRNKANKLQGHVGPMARGRSCNGFVG